MYIKHNGMNYTAFTINGAERLISFDIVEGNTIMLMFHDGPVITLKNVDGVMMPARGVKSRESGFRNQADMTRQLEAAGVYAAALAAIKQQRKRLLREKYYDYEKRIVTAEYNRDSRGFGYFPAVQKVSFYLENGTFKVNFANPHLVPDTSKLADTGEGMGNVLFHKIEHGVYLIKNVLENSRAEPKTIILVINDHSENGFDCFDVDDIDEAVAFSGFNVNEARHA